MGKKKKKKKKKKALKGLPISVLENKAEASLISGSFRNARDFFKELCRYDEKKYLPRVIESCEGLALQMIREGRLKDAKAVLANMKKLGANPANGRVEVSLLVKGGDFAGAGAAASQYLAGCDANREPAEGLIYDALILSFEELESLPSISSGLREDATAIHSAMRHLCEGECEEALSSLKPVGFRSPFSHWRLFVKGLCAFYSMEDEKALKAFVRLPAGSILATAVEPYLIMMDAAKGIEKISKKEGILELVCRIAGGEDLKEALPRAEYLWRVGRFRDSYRLLRKQLDGFPSEKGGVIHSLSTFYLNSVFHMEQGRANKYLDFLTHIRSRNQKSNKTERLMIQRIESLFANRGPVPDSILVEIWEEFLLAHREVYGEDLNLEAVVYTHLGDIFSTEEVDHSPFSYFSPLRRSRRPTLRNVHHAEEFYKKALRLTPGSREIHFSLLGLYEKLGDKSRVNRRLDEIIKLFPGDKEALYKAGLRCIERKALIKGMKYLERALELDPIDKKLRESFIIGCINAAQRYAEKPQMDRCRGLLSKALEKGSPESNDFNRGHPYLYARWSNLELLNGNVKRAETLMTKALSLIINECRLIYFNWLIGRVYQVPPQHLRAARDRMEMEFSGDADTQKAVLFVETISYFFNFHRLDWLDDELYRVDIYALDAAKKGFSRGQAKTIIDYALSEPVDNEELAEIVIKKTLRRNPEDPLFLFYRYEMKVEGRSAPPGMKELEELQRILSLAEKERDQELVLKIRHAIEEIERSQALSEHEHPFDAGPFFDDDFDDDEFDEDDDEFEGHDFDDGSLGEAFDSFLDTLMNDPEKILSRLGQKARKGAKKKKKPRGLKEDKQLNLFE